MKRLLLLATFAVVLALPASSTGGGLASGTWKLTALAPAGTSESVQLLVKLETKDGKTEATLLAVPPSKAKAATPPKTEIVSFTTKGDRVRLVFKMPAEQVFQGAFPRTARKSWASWATIRSRMPRSWNPLR